MSRTDGDARGGLYALVFAWSLVAGELGLRGQRNAAVVGNDGLDDIGFQDHNPDTELGEVIADSGYLQIFPAGQRNPERAGEPLL